MRLEHPEAARHVAQQARHLGEEEDAEEVEKVMFQSPGQQGVEHRAGQRPVERGDADLGERHPRPGDGELQPLEATGRRRSTRPTR